GQRDQSELAKFHLDAGRRAFDREADREAVVERRRALFLSPYLGEAPSPPRAGRGAKDRALERRDGGDTRPARRSVSAESRHRGRASGTGSRAGTRSDIPRGAAAEGQARGG